MQKKTLSTSLIFWLRTQKEDGPNTTRLRPTSKYRRSHNGTIQKHESKIRSPDEDTDYFDIVAGVLQGDAVYNLPRLRA